MATTTGFDPPGVHVWTFSTAPHSQLAARLEALLSPDEVDRAKRFRFDSLRDSFVIARGTLRSIASAYLNVPAPELRFTYGDHGKPALQDYRLHFNLSHSGEVAMLALAEVCPVGIDLERVRCLDDMHRIAERFFCSDEALELASLPASQQGPAFFRCWTRKEAYLKATGDGIGVALDRFRVSLMPDKPARFLYIEGSCERAQSWSLHDLPAPPGYVAALAYPRLALPVTFFSFSPHLNALGEEDH